MRKFLSVLILPALIAPALGQEAPKPEAVHHARMTWEQKFNQANLTHNGHLTLEQAKGAYPLVAKHFDDIDADHKGFVTENDIRAWHVMRRASHRLSAPPAGGVKAQHAEWVRPIQP